jgi:hypothetical protein
MTFRGYQYSVSATVDLSLHEVQFIRQMALRHYDATCRQAAGVGGFLYSWKNRFSLWAGDLDRAQISVNSSEADLVCKILERDTQRVAWLSLVRLMMNQHRLMNPGEG